VRGAAVNIRIALGVTFPHDAAFSAISRRKRQGRVVRPRTCAEIHVLVAGASRNGMVHRKMARPIGESGMLFLWMGPLLPEG
jgi:hypothetical protein